MMMKKSLLTILCILLSTMSWAQGTTTGDESYNEAYAVLVIDENNTASLTMYYDANKESHQEGQVIGLDEMVTNQQLMMNRANIQTVTFDSSFANCRPTSTYYWFAGCSALTTINGMEYLKTDEVTSMQYMFSGCSSLTELNLTSFNTTNVTDMSRMFMNCSSLTSLDLSNFNTANVTSMESLFYQCSGLTSLNLDGLNTANVTDMGGMFYGCRGLTNLNVTGFNTEKVTNMSSMFWACSRLTSLDVSSFNTANVTMMQQMFADCSGLNTIYAGNEWSTASVTSGEQMFFLCESLMGGAGTVFSEDHMDYTYARIDGGENAPGYFTDIADKDTPQPYAVLSSNNTVLTFYYDNQKSVRGGMNLRPFVGFGDRGWDNVVQTITDIVFDDSFKDYQPTSMSWWFYEMTNLSSISGISNLNTSNVTDMSQLFVNCYNLSNIDVSGFDTQNVTNMEAMFRRCTGLTELDLSSFKTEKVSNMGYMFEECINLKTIYVGSGWTTDNVTTSNQMFVSCNSLEGSNGTVYNQDNITATYAHIDGGTANPGYLTDKNAPQAYAVLSDNNTVLTFYYDMQKKDRGGMSIIPISFGGTAEWSSYASTITSVVFDTSFAACTTLSSTAYWFNNLDKLTSVSGLGNLNTENVTDMGGMFWSCSSLTSVDVSGFNTANVTDMQYMFSNCESLTGLDVSGFNTENVTSMVCMFAGCYRLTNLDVSRFNTDKVTNMRAMFTGCNITSLDLSRFNTANVSNMATMFSGCSALTTIYGGDGWSTAAITNGTGMFGGCSALVGGAGTTYSEDHTDHTYAHIDGGTANPGYFTDKNAPVTISAPVFTFDGDNLTMTTETTNASIFYKMADLDSTEENYVDSVSSHLVVTADGQQSTYYERPFELVKSAVVKAIAVADVQNRTIVSDTTTLVYDYAAWQNLRVAVERGNEVNARAQGNSAVDSTLLADLQWALEEGNMIYRERAMMNSFEATHFAERITELCNQIEAQMTSTDEPYAVLSDNNTVLTFYYDENKTSRGGMEIFPFMYEGERGWNSNDETITRVVFDDSFANCSTVSSTAYWFYNLRNLTTVEGIQNLNTQNVTDMSYMFMYCNSLTTIDVTNFKTDNVTNMNSMFGYCFSLATIDVSGFNTEKVTGMWGMFARCNVLTSLDVSGFNTQNVTNMSQMFESCANLHELDVRGFNTQNVTNMNGMFEGCWRLKSLDLSSFNTHSTVNMGRLFYACDSLTTICIDSSWTTASVTVGDDMFTGCTSLVGGAGTTYSADHVDHTYAHIDGGTANPGYFTDKNATPTEKVATPTFSWRNDELTMSCSTEGATIMYQMSDEDTNGDGVINDDDYKQYSAPIEVKRDVIIKAIATKQGMITSDTIELDYPYTAWAKLYDVCTIGQEILSRASRSSRVPQEMVDRGEAYIAYALDMYAKRTEDKERVENTTADIAVFLNEIEQMMQVPASYSNYVLTAEEDATMAEIADQYGSYYGNQVAAIVWNSSVPMTESDLQRFTSNPNLLIYAQSESMVPANRDNVVINGVAKNVVLTDTVSGNCNFYAPQAFTAEAIQYTRTFSQQTQIGVSRGWEAIALPFTVQTYTHADRGVIAPFGNSASENHFWLRELTQNGLQNAQTIEANKPYIISMPNSEEYRPETNLAGQVTFSALNAIVPVTEATPVEYGSISLVPAFQSRSAQTEIYALNVGEERNGYPEGSVFERDYRTVRPFEAYTLHRDNQNPAPQYISIAGDMGNGTTGIEELVDKRMNTNDSWYTFDGRRLQGAPAGKGLYIRNGKKVIVR